MGRDGAERRPMAARPAGEAPPSGASSGAAAERGASAWRAGGGGGVGSCSAQPPAGLGSVPSREGSGGAEGSRGGSCGLLARVGGVVWGMDRGQRLPGRGRGS